MLTSEILVRIRESRKIRSPGNCLQFRENTVVPLLCLQLRDTTVWIIDIAENNSLRRTRLLACSLNVPIHNFAVFEFGLNLCFVDPLNTIRALLHYAPTSDRHIRIYRKGRRLRLKNLGMTPVTVNGSQVNPKSKHRLVLPSIIRLNDKIKINLSLLKSKVNSHQDGRKNQNGNE